MPPVATFVSYRLGGADGVGVEARKWAWALQQPGYATRRVAGALEDERGPDDVELPWLALDALDALGAHDGIDGHDGIDPPASARAELQDALGRSDLVVVENVCSLPINVAAARAAAAVVADVDAHVLFHHHDLPWQRRAFRDFAEEFPPVGGSSAYY